MNNMNVIRAWSDSDYRQSLSEIERAILPAHPAGLLELTEAELAEVAGGKKKKKKKSRSRSRSRSRS
jgi:mersacidin/lichenicidin family type 2 lantibiotic